MGRRRGRRGSRRRGGLRKQRRGSKWQGIKNLVLIVGFVVIMAGVALSGGANDSPDTAAETVVQDDTDQDRIPDSWERSESVPDGAPLPSADPDQMDLYVQVVTAENVQPLTDRERTQLRAIWAEMPVGTDGSGIDLHFVDGQQLNEPVTIEGDAEDFDDLKSEYYGGISPDACVYQTVMLVEVTAENVAGRGHSPGYFLFADGSQRTTRSSYSNRVTTITHELLHNVVGDIGVNGHTDEGWLGTDHDTYLSKKTSQRLNSSGFAVPEAYDGCDIP